MATPLVFDCLVEDIGKGVHDFENDEFRIFLTNSTPSASADAVYADLTDLATAGGYTSGGVSIGPNTWGQAGGVAEFVAGVNADFVAVAGFGPFRYAVLYNFTAAGQNLVCAWDGGSPISVAAGKTFSVQVGARIFALSAS